MASKVDEWRRLVDQHFGFVEEYGFRLEPRFNESDFWTTRVVYICTDRGLAVDKSVEFNRAEVSLIRLDAGHLPAPQIWVTGEKLTTVLLDNVLRVRAPELYTRVSQLSGLGERELGIQLAAHAQALRDVAEDFLRGSFNAMDAGERLIRHRVELNPQELVVWLPEHATAEEEHAMVEKARATAPPEVAVIARRYGRS